MIEGNPDVIVRNSDHTPLQEERFPTKPSLCQEMIKTSPVQTSLWNSFVEQLFGISQNKRDCTYQRTLQKLLTPRHWQN